MSDPVTAFFNAWALSDDAERHATISAAVTADIQYDDPRTPDTLQGIDALSAYVGEFSANAPGWSARVVKSDTIAGMTRATIAFGGPGPDGNDIVQHGQYFVEMDGERVSRMVGFVGTGQPD